MRKNTGDTNDEGNHKFNDQFIAAIHGLQFSMKFLGLWGRTSDFVWYLQFLGLVFIWFGTIAGLIVHMDNTEILIDILSSLIPITCLCLKWITFAIQRRAMAEVLYCMDKDWTNLEQKSWIDESVPGSQRIMARYSRIPRIFLLTTVAMSTGGVAGYVRDSLASRDYHDNSTDSNKLLPMPHSWYPVDYDRGFNFELLVAAQGVTTFTLSLAGITVDSFFVTAMLHLCGQFRILRCFIDGIKYDSSRPEYCKAQVKVMVHRHQVLLGVAEIIQEAYNILLLLQLATSTLTICFLGYVFMAEMEKDHARPTVLLKTGFAGGDVLLLIFSYCLVGDILTNQSFAVAMAIYNTEWYKFAKSINLSFALVMTRAGIPLKITGAKILPMSLESFMVILKVAVSYLSVLREVSGNQSYKA